MDVRTYLRAADVAPGLPAPPVAEPRPKRLRYHGRELVDEYAWLRDPSYPEVQDEQILGYLRAENEYFQKAMEPHRDSINALFEELKGRLKEDEEGVPAKDGKWEFWWRFEKGEEYREHLRRRIDGGSPELFLSEPELARGTEYFRLGGLDVSQDGRVVAYSTDTEGDERYTMRFRPEAEEIRDTIGDPIWLADNRTILYLELSDEWRPFRVRAHTVGTDPEEDPILYEEEDTSFFVHVDLSQSRAYVLVTTGDHVTNETWVCSMDDLLRFLASREAAGPEKRRPGAAEESPFRLLIDRREGEEQELDHHGEYFFILTNDRHKNFRLVRAPVNGSGREEWEEIIAPSDRVYLRGLTCFSSFMVLEERVDGVDQVRLREYEGEEHRVRFPEAAYTAGLHENPEYELSTVRLHYQSMVTPPTVYDYHVAQQRLEVRKVKEIPSGYDPSEFATERLLIPARDGTAVPASIVYPKDLPKDGSRPLYLYAYGAYGMGISPHFSTNALSLLKRGFSVAVAHVRGGDELGYHWYEAGKLDRRTNTFNDFVDVARGLIEHGLTSEGLICARGGSAGGELMGAVVNTAPELFRAVIAEVPFVDVLNTMLDDSLPLTPIEWPEWGNPIADSDAFDLIRSYSPYDNVREQGYPPLLITAGLSDPRVAYWEPAKWAARLRDRKTDDNVLLLKTNMSAGHGGRSGRYAALAEEAEILYFLLLATGGENLRGVSA
ncbi:MAG: S9 family peptidase [Spirochaetaceae bacterium]